MTAVKAGKSVCRTTLAELIGALLKAGQEGRLAERTRFHAWASLLIIDVIVCLPITGRGGNLFFQLVNARNEKGTMILTSNRGFTELGDIFGSPVVATTLFNMLWTDTEASMFPGKVFERRPLRGHGWLMS